MANICFTREELVDIMEEEDEIEEGDTAVVQFAGKKAVFEISSIYRDQELAQVVVEIEHQETHDANYGEIEA